MRFFIMLLVVSLLASVFKQFIPVVDYSDEAIAILFAVVALLKVIVREKRGQATILKNEAWILVISLLLLIVGMTTNALLKEGPSLFLQLYTYFGLVKLVLIFVGGRILFSEVNFAPSGKGMVIFARCFTAICYLLLALQMVHPLFPTFGLRYGINTFAFGFEHPAQFAITIITLTIIKTYIQWSETGKIAYVYLILNLLLVVAAGRTTSITFYIVMIVAFLVTTKIKKIPKVFYIITAGLLLFLGKDRIVNQFFGNNEEARGLLIRTALKIANEHHGFGFGFGTFGSNASRLDYSPVYHQYGLSNIWGLSPQAPQFITDSYWAMVIGEIGYVGMAFMLIILGLLLKIVINETNKGTGKSFFTVLILLYVLITSPVDTALISSSVAIAMLGTLYVTYYQKQENVEQKKLVEENLSYDK